MRIRTQNAGQTRPGPQMAPMIDIVFQLLIFFLLTLKIVEPEGEFRINMPLDSAQASSQEIILPALKVTLLANDDGTLNSIQFGQRNLGGGPDVFRRLNQTVLQVVGQADGPQESDVEIEIDADYNLDYSYTIRAVSACTGTIDPTTRLPVRYVDKIKFTPPEKPGSE